jgi:hypothetical protein
VVVAATEKKINRCQIDKIFLPRLAKIKRIDFILEAILIFNVKHVFILPL